MMDHRSIALCMENSSKLWTAYRYICFPTIACILKLYCRWLRNKKEISQKFSCLLKRYQQVR